MESQMLVEFLQEFSAGIGSLTCSTVVLGSVTNPMD